MKICCTCKEAKPYEDFHKSRAIKDGHNNECKECKRVRDRGYQREYQKKHVRGTVNRHARLRVSIAVQSGRLKPIAEMKCSICGCPARHRHHLDYEKDLLVDLCAGCHGQAHSRAATEGFTKELWQNSYRLRDAQKSNNL